MKSNTRLHAAFRNIGNANDSGQMVEGELKELIVWLAHKFAETTLATRIVIGLGRTKEDAERAIIVDKATRVTKDTEKLLESLFDSVEFQDDDEPQETA